MNRQRGVVLLLALNLSLLLGLLTALGMRSALQQARQVGEQILRVQAFEQAEASLIEGTALLDEELPAQCGACLPPDLPLASPGAAWQATESGFVLLQAIGETRRAAGLATGEPVMLVRITALGRETRGRQFLEAVYAVDDQAGVRRVSWRQRLEEG
jgi:type IV pilus assembly protein PilX